MTNHPKLKIIKVVFAFGMYVVLKLECVSLMLREFTILCNSHKETLTWSWEGARFLHFYLSYSSCKNDTQKLQLLQ